jgi:hypothetical protein
MFHIFLILMTAARVASKQELLICDLDEIFFSQIFFMYF